MAPVRCARGRRRLCVRYCRPVRRGCPLWRGTQNAGSIFDKPPRASAAAFTRYNAWHVSLICP